MLLFGIDALVVPMMRSEEAGQPISKTAFRAVPARRGVRRLDPGHRPRFPGFPSGDLVCSFSVLRSGYFDQATVRWSPLFGQVQG